MKPYTGLIIAISLQQDDYGNQLVPFAGLVTSAREIDYGTGWQVTVVVFHPDTGQQVLLGQPDWRGVRSAQWIGFRGEPIDPMTAEYMVAYLPRVPREDRLDDERSPITFPTIDAGMDIRCGYVATDPGALLGAARFAEPIPCTENTVVTTAGTFTPDDGYGVTVSLSEEPIEKAPPCYHAIEGGPQHGEVYVGGIRQPAHAGFACNKCNTKLSAS